MSKEGSYRGITVIKMVHAAGHLSSMNAIEAVTPGKKCFTSGKLFQELLLILF